MGEERDGEGEESWQRRVGREERGPDESGGVHRLGPGRLHPCKVDDMRVVARVGCDHRAMSSTVDE